VSASIPVENCNVTSVWKDGSSIAQRFPAAEQLTYSTGEENQVLDAGRLDTGQALRQLA